MYFCAPFSNIQLVIVSQLGYFMVCQAGIVNMNTTRNVYFISLFGSDWLSPETLCKKDLTTEIREMVKSLLDSIAATTSTGNQDTGAAFKKSSTQRPFGRLRPWVHDKNGMPVKKPEIY
jgi:hypothetical protein